MSETVEALRAELSALRAEVFDAQANVRQCDEDKDRVQAALLSAEAQYEAVLSRMESVLSRLSRLGAF